MSLISGVPDNTQFALLRLIAGSSSSVEVLNAICRSVEERIKGCTCAVLLVDPQTHVASFAAAPSLPHELINDTSGAPHKIALSTTGGPGSLLRSIRSMEELEALPAWNVHARALRRHGMTACTVMPVLSLDLRPVGAFLVSCRTPGKFSAAEIGYLRDTARLASLLFDGIPEAWNGAGRLPGHSPAVTALWNAIEGRRWIDRIMKAFPDMVYIFDQTERRLVYISRSCERVTGYTMSELLALGSGLLDHLVHPDDNERVRSFLDKWSQVTESTVRSIQYRAAHKTAGWRWISQRSFVASIDEGGHPTASFGIMQDVTESRLREQRLHQTERLEALGRMAGGIAHDFNNLLSVILLSSEIIDEVLQTIPEPSVAREANTDLKDAAVRARDLVQRLMASSQTIEKNREYFRPGEILSHALYFIRGTLAPSVVLNTEMEVGTGLVEGDSLQIRNAMLNILANAAYALRDVSNPRLDVHLSFSARELEPDDADAPGRGVLLVFRDNGVGMEPATLERAFEPFFTTRPAGEGVGLGLAVALGVVRSHGGQLRMHSKPGMGTTVEMWLPLVEAAGERQEATRLNSDSNAKPLDRQPVEVGISADLTSMPRRQKHRARRIALVDDEPAVARACARILTAMGHEVTAITDPREALRVLMNPDSAFDVLFTDQSMPGMTGTELARAVHAVNADLPILLCSGFNSVPADETQSDAAIHAFLSKPLDRNQLRRVLDSLP